MKIQLTILFLITAFSSLSVNAGFSDWFHPSPEKKDAPTPPPTVKGDCVFVSRNIDIIAKIDDHTYEIDFYMAGVGLFQATRMILITTNTVFSGAGRIPYGTNIWLDVQKGPGETIELPLSNGFTKKFWVSRESDACRIQDEAKKAKNKAKKKKVATEDEEQ